VALATGMVMFLMWLLGAITGGSLGFGFGVRWMSRYYHKRTFPHQWNCPEENCEYEIGTSDLGFLDRLIETHEQGHRWS